MPETGELRSQRPKVVNLAVVTDRPAAVGGVPRLDCPLSVDDFQPLSTQLMPVLTERLPHFPARRYSVKHRVEDQRVRARPDNEGNTAHIVDPFWRLAQAQLALVSGLQFVACERVDTQMPRLALVDDIELARLLALKRIRVRKLSGSNRRNQLISISHA